MDLLERPLTARSVVLSLLLGRHPPRAPVALLVRWCALFGISTTATRVALSRMVERGELTAADATYALAGRALGRQVEQDVALAEPPDEWDGTWRVAVVAAGTRPADDRAALRAAMARLHLVELRDGVWTRPDNLPVGTWPSDARAVVDDQCEWWTGARPHDGAALARGAFGVEAWAARGSLLLDRLRDATSTLMPASLAPAFVAGAATAQHLRRDPLLPAELLPERWPGAALRAAYVDYVDRMGAVIATWAASGSGRAAAAD